MKHNAVYRSVLKKSLVLIMALSVCLIRYKTYADVIYEPQDDFFYQHTLEMKALNENRYVSGKEEPVKAYKSPSDKGVVTSFNKGDEVYVLYTYLDNNDHDWSLMETRDSEGNNKTCWIPSIYLVQDKKDVDRDTSVLPVIVPDDRRIYRYFFFICAGMTGAALIFMAVYVNVTMKKRRERYM